MPGKDITIEKYADGFFDWEGTWALNKRIEGQRIGRRHCRDRADILRIHVLPALGKYRLTDIDKHKITAFRNSLFNKGYSGSVINKCLYALKTILETAEDEGLIPAVPKIRKASSEPQRPKGILTIAEVSRLFSFQWMSEPAHCHPAKSLTFAYTGNLLAASTGLRLSELQGLKLKDLHLDAGYIVVKRAWDVRLNRLNETTKTGRERNVFIPKKVINSLFDLLKEHPALDNPESFLFFGKKKSDEKPAEQAYFVRALYKALQEIGITEEQRKARNITFHSWRHFLNSLLINSKIPIQKIQSIIGHTTSQMSAHYYHIDDMADVRKVQENLFSGNAIAENDDMQDVKELQKSI